MTRFIAVICYWMGIDRLFYWLNRSAKRIITFHNVIPDVFHAGGLANGVSCSESAFRSIVDLVAREFSFSTDMSDARTVTLTFDDGYLNQYEVAFKILSETGIPAVLFFSGQLVGSQDKSNALVVDLILHWLDNVPAGEYRLDVDGVGLLSITEGNRLRVWLDVLRPLYVHDSAARGRNVLAACDKAYPMAELFRKCDAEYVRLRFSGITNEQFSEMRRKGWKIGYHTYSHFPLGDLPEAEMKKEMTSPPEYKHVVFSYPYGELCSMGEREIQEARRQGYPSAVSNSLQPSNAMSRYFIPRMALSCDKYLLHFVLSGVKYFLKYHSLLPRVS